MVILSESRTIHLLPPRWPDVDYDGAFQRGVERLSDLYANYLMVRDERVALEPRVLDGNAWLDRHKDHERYQINLRRLSDLAWRLHSTRSAEYLCHCALWDQVQHLHHVFAYSHNQNICSTMLTVDRDAYRTPEALWQALFPDVLLPAKENPNGEGRPARVSRARSGRRVRRAA